MTSIKRYLRLKPKGDSPEDQDKEYLIDSQTSTHVRFKDTTSPNKFNKIFTEKESQAEIYEETLKDITLSLFEKQDGVLFTLGPSNSGKSYTLLGNISNPGITIYALNDIFNTIGTDIADHSVLKEHLGNSLVVSSRAKDVAANSAGQYGVSISVFEIYNDKIKDLTLDSSKTLNQSLDIVTDSRDGKIKPSKIRQIYISNMDEGKLVLHKSIKRRAVSPTNINGTSSRSHLFVHLNLHTVFGSVIKTSRLTIADLAGSERTKTARTEGTIFKEGTYTNQSLTELGRCLKMMQSSTFDSSVLRTSKLTRLLLTDLFRNSHVQNKLKIVLALDPYSELSTILHTLRYIQPVSKLPTSERSSTESAHDSVHINKLIEETAALRASNHILVKENGQVEEKLMKLEIELRQELAEEYEEKIQQLENLHNSALSELRNKNDNSNDQKLQILSEDYEQRIEQIKKNYDVKIDELENSNEQLSKQYKDESKLTDKNLQGLEEKITTLEEEKFTFEKKYKELKKEKKSSIKSLNEEIESLKKAHKDSENALLAKVEQSNKENDELKSKIKEMEVQLKSLREKEKAKTKTVSELEPALKSTQKKRKSTEVLNDGISSNLKNSKKTRANKNVDIYKDFEEDEDTFGFENESDLTSFSPIVFSQGNLVPSSPAKSPLKNHFRIPMARDSSSVSPSRPVIDRGGFKGIETPMLFPSSISPKKSSKLTSKNSPRKVLKEVNLDFPASIKSTSTTSPKKSSPLKSPSKKKKIRTGAMISPDEVDDLF